MTKSDILMNINTSLAGEQLTWKMALQHINWAIDGINSEMNTIFPAVTAEDTEYTAFPDKYIRSVLIPGAVHHYYMVDDEGSTGEQDFHNEYRQGLFIMLRDYSHQIPIKYQDDVDNGTADAAWEVRGVWF